MVSLTEMLNQKKQLNQPPEQRSGNDGLRNAVNDRPVSTDVVEATADAASTNQIKSSKVPPGNTPAQIESKAGTKPVTGLKLGGLKLKSNTSSELGGSNESSGIKLAGITRQPNNSNLVAEPKSGGSITSKSNAGIGLSLVDIAGLDDSDDSKLIGIDESGDGYLDQVPATAPVRELPPELDEQQKGFVKSLDAIYSLHAEPDLFVNMVSKIMSDMADNPALADLLADEDSNAMIRGLRQSAGLAQVKKQESKAKRGGRSSKPNPKLDEALATLQGIAGFDALGD